MTPSNAASDFPTPEIWEVARLVDAGVCRWASGWPSSHLDLATWVSRSGRPGRSPGCRLSHPGRGRRDRPRLSGSNRGCLSPHICRSPLWWQLSPFLTNPAYLIEFEVEFGGLFLYRDFFLGQNVIARPQTNPKTRQTPTFVGRKKSPI